MVLHSVKILNVTRWGSGVQAEGEGISVKRIIVVLATCAVQEGSRFETGMRKS
jgi:hypothetical protein